MVPVQMMLPAIIAWTTRPLATRNVSVSHDQSGDSFPLEGAVNRGPDRRWIVAHEAGAGDPHVSQTVNARVAPDVEKDRHISLEALCLPSPRLLDAHEAAEKMTRPVRPTAHWLEPWLRPGSETVARYACLLNASGLMARLAAAAAEPVRLTTVPSSSGPPSLRRKCATDRTCSLLHTLSVTFAVTTALAQSGAVRPVLTSRRYCAGDWMFISGSLPTE
jgi:hypothetical protein